MGVPYVVRKKVDMTSGERKELWYGVPRKLQQRGGVNNKELAAWMEKTSGFHRGQIEGILTEMVANILQMLSLGESVTIDGLGTFQTALTSPGFERPEQVTPGKVSVSRVYFVAHPDFRREVKKIKCVRIPFKYYMPENMLTKEMEKVDKEQEREESGAEMWEEESGE
ncbi:HU family DNA-binding protein [Bacteroides sp.]|uniref:HU family DNA-binding protein n=1 Tax=Bacteroides sp. TaxID=29523 RepID=UPI0026246DD8|nr:HU family DNA-binding protein [Bacteroides sp.]MDD3038344.1 DNA-binding protein [Bacteroides sp.]